MSIFVAEATSISPHWRATLQMSLRALPASLFLGLQLDDAYADTYGRQAIQMRRVWQVLRTIRQSQTTQKDARKRVSKKSQAGSF